ncbi:MAG: hypothetical protein ABIU85_09540 [Methylotenera sp.]
MKREDGVAIYFWGLILLSAGLAYKYQTTAAVVAFTGAIIIAVINLIARDYFDNA